VECAWYIDDVTVWVYGTIRDERMTRLFPSRSLVWLAALGLADLLLVAPAGTMPRVAGAMLLLLLPGLALAEVFLPNTPRLLRWVVGLGTSIMLIPILALSLHNLPGPVSLWMAVALLNLLVAGPPLIRAVVVPRPAGTTTPAPGSATLSTTVWLLAAVIAGGIVLRFAWLDYSEFQGDEALAMISAAEVIEGHADALYLRGKGPGEVLLPVMLWRLTGTINEGIARLPFAVAGSLVPAMGFLLATSLFSRNPSGPAAGLAAAILLAVNGFMVAFSRIVQYQALVVLMSGLALLCAGHWYRDRGGMRWLPWCGLFLGAGLLAHYDTLLVVPAVVYLIAAGLRRTDRLPAGRTAVALLSGGIAVAAVSGLFYVPYLLDPQAARTGSYLGDRIGDQLIKNNLASFQQLNVFYTSFFYHALTGLLVLAWLAWTARRARGLRRLPGASVWLPGLLTIAVLGVTIWPHALRTPSIDLAGLPFTVLLLCACLAVGLDDGRRAVVLWLAVPFLGYNFGVAVPLTHIYTIVPAWTLLAGLAVAGVVPYLTRRWYIARPAAVAALCVSALFTGYVVLAYLRHDVEFRQDWPRSHVPLYWTPYVDTPPTGFFGFPHRTGWKAVGALYAAGRLVGDYGSNEEPDITAWYTRGAARACDPAPNYYFIADGVVDPWPVDMPAIQAAYDLAGRVTLPNGRGLTVYEARPTTERLGPLDLSALEAAFDRSATPDAFARSGGGGQAVAANLGGLVRLMSYDIDTQRAWPGGRLTVTLYWQPLQQLAEDYHVFVHLEAGPVRSQADGRPVCWTYPTTDWRPGQVIADHYALAILPDTPPGAHPLLVGMYAPTDGRRLDVLGADGVPTGSAVSLGDVTVR
jgi:4-amino-4-deoxy-L-arabinose transferase-like glycosyltransferase